MGQKSAIAWTDATFNPWWGCTKVSSGCERCYAETFSKRVGQNVWGPQSERRLFKDKHWNEPLKWNKAAAASGKPFRVFCASMADVFEDRRDLDAPRERLFKLIEDTPALTWLLLTKRPENMRMLAPSRWDFKWPTNVIAMTTVENQENANIRLPHLEKVPAKLRGVSYEPAIGPVRVSWSRFKINWVIAGGESGAGSRPMPLEWARDVRDDAQAGGTKFFMKQLGGVQDKKDKLEDFPADLQIRDFPI